MFINLKVKVLLVVLQCAHRWVEGSSKYRQLQIKMSNYIRNNMMFLTVFNLVFHLHPECEQQVPEVFCLVDQGS